jgi:hypothetical protein
MKPSDKSLLEICKVWQERMGMLDFDIGKFIAIAYAIDVDPLLAEKDAEIGRLTKDRDEANKTIVECGFDRAKQRIAELEAENTKLKCLLNTAV